MELVFHKENGLYITEFEVTSDFNVHLERSKGGKVSFYQKTTDGNYDHIEKLSKNIDKVFDYDFQALVYPKIIKITSECEFDVASLSTDGEVTEIKSQSKEVEITANGVTEIAPDNGFGYLSGVKVNVNVPQGGGGDAPSGGGVKYLDLRGIDELVQAQIMMYAYISAGFTTEGDFVAIPPLLGAAVPSFEVKEVVGAVIPVGVYAYMQGQKTELSSALEGQFGQYFKYLTEEEFYNPATYA